MLAINGGRPEQLNLKDMIAAFTAFREEVVSRRTKHPADEVARPRARVGRPRRRRRQHRRDDPLIRSAPSPAEAREQMMARDWPAQGHRPAGRADRRPAPQGLRRRHLSSCPTSRPRAILDLRLQRLTALGRDEIGDELKKLGEEIKDYLAILVLAPAHRRHRQEGAHRHQGRVRHARATPRSSRWRARSRTRT